MELEADPEHQEDDPELGELLRHRPVGHETRGHRPHGDPGEKVAHDGGQAQALRHVPERQGRGQPTRQRHDEIEIVHRLHRPHSVGSRLSSITASKSVIRNGRNGVMTILRATSRRSWWVGS